MKIYTEIPNVRYWFDSDDRTWYAQKIGGERRICAGSKWAILTLIAKGELERSMSEALACLRRVRPVVGRIIASVPAGCFRAAKRLTPVP